MALISVAQPQQKAPKASTYDRIIQGVQLANSLLGTALNAAELKTKFDTIDVAKRELDQKEYDSYLKTFEKFDVVPEKTEGSFELRIPKTNQPIFVKPKPGEVEEGVFQDLVMKGGADWIANAETANKLKAEGRPVQEWTVKGIGKQFVLPNPDRIQTFLDAAAEKAAADIGKTKAETEKLSREPKDELYKQEDELRKEIEGRPEVRAFREAQAIDANSASLVEDGSPQAQYGLVVGFVRSLAPGVVSEREVAMAGQGAIGENLARELAKFGIDYGITKDAKGNPRIFLSEKAAKNIARAINSNLKARKKALEPTLASFREQIKKRGLDEANVLLPFEVSEFEEQKKPSREELIKELEQ